jgi:hypothetical protein
MRILKVKKKSACNVPCVHRCGVEVWLYSFLTSVLDGGGLSAPHPDYFTLIKSPSIHCIGGWMGPKASPDGCGEEESPAFNRVSMLNHPACSMDTVPTAIFQFLLTELEL